MPQYSGTRTETITRLERLADYGLLLRAPDASFGEWVSTSGKGTAEEPFTLPWFKLSPLGSSFVHMLHEAGWIVDGFNWSAWMRGPEGRMLMSDPAAVSRASADQLAMLLTVWGCPGRC